MSRSSRPDVRNPILRLPSSRRLLALSPVLRAELRAVLLDIRADAQIRAQDCWKRHKGPMALYWKTLATYVGHIAKLLR